MATQLTDEASIGKILEEMSVSEKAACITGATSFGTRAMPKYGIPSLLMLDGGTGVNTNEWFLDDMYRRYAAQKEAEGDPVEEDACTGRMGGLELVLNDHDMWEHRKEHAREFMGEDTAYGCFPPGMALAATWNPEVIERCGEALGREANARGLDVLLGTPNVNIHRDPRNGRHFEGYSEDPCLTASLAPSFVRGVRAGGILADVKHFAANNQETDRMGVDEHISERALREIYLPGFEACVREGCETVMSAYNKINGVPCAQNPWLLQDVLRGEWGFDGFVVTDWSAAYDQVEACAAGNDLVMPGPRQQKTIVEAVENGTLPEEALDACVRNFLKGVLKAPVMKGRLASYSVEESREAAYEAIAEALTLLKNDGALPLDPLRIRSLSLYGERSRHIVDSGAGSAFVNTTLTTQISDSLAALFGEERIVFGAVTESTDAVIVTVGANGQEGADRIDMQLEPEDRRALDEAVAAAKEASERFGRKIPVIALLNVAGPVELMKWEKDLAAVLCLYIPGMEGGRAAADVLVGKINPSGKLPTTFPRWYRDCPTFGNFPGYDSEVWYGEGIYVGYRYYEKKQVEVLYPFGHGLSYTSFELRDVTVPGRIDAEKEPLEVKVTVVNTGGCAGAEVVQVYVEDPVSTLDKPVKELKGFRKVFLQSGEERTVTIRLGKKDFASYDTRLRMWAAEPGLFRIHVGTSSRDIACVKEVQVDCENPYSVGPLTDIVKVVSNEQALAIAEEKTGVKLQEVAGSYIVFQPLTTFEQVWTECVKPAMKADAETAEAVKREIYAAWKRL